MTIAHDTETRFPTTENTADTTTGDRTFTHTPVGTPKGVVVAICSDNSAAPVTGVLYGSSAMTVTQSATDTDEVGRVDIYTLTDTAVPTGAQTVTLQGCTATAKFATCSTATAVTDQTTVNTSGAKNTTTSTNPFIELTYTAEAIAYGAMHWGGTSWPTVPQSGQTDQHHRDYGLDSAITARRTAAEAVGAHQIGWTASTEDHCLVAVALAEKSGGSAQTVSPSSIGSAEAFGTAAVTPGAVTVSPTGIASAQAFGTAAVTSGPVTVAPTGIASGQAFGTPTITPGPVTVSPTSIATGEAFGTAAVAVGGVTRGSMTSGDRSAATANPADRLAAGASPGDRGTATMRGD